MINFYTYFSQVIIWSMTFFLTSQTIFYAGVQSTILAAIPILYAIAALSSPVLVRVLSERVREKNCFAILSAARFVTILPVLLWGGGKYAAFVLFYTMPTFSCVIPLRGGVCVIA